MLHAINASGKSTITKSLGVAIIMAQAGFSVPAQSFRFSLFDSLFTRISGSDDIHKGLSTFTIEMLEMKNIFNTEFVGRPGDMYAPRRFEIVLSAKL